MDIHLCLYGMSGRCYRLGALSPKFTFIIVEKGKEQVRGINPMPNNISCNKRRNCKFVRAGQLRLTSRKICQNM